MGGQRAVSPRLGGQTLELSGAPVQGCKEPALAWLALRMLGESRGLERSALAKHAGITQAERDAEDPKILNHLPSYMNNTIPEQVLLLGMGCLGSPEHFCQILSQAESSSFEA